MTAMMQLRATGDDVFEAPASPERTGRMYGGQFLAQGLAAADLTVTDDRLVHSLHGYFLRPGDVEATLEVAVERVRDGRSFSARNVVIRQHGKELFRMAVSYHVPEPGDEYAGATMPDVPEPESVTLTYNQFSLDNGESPDWDGEARPMDVRYINPPTAPAGVPVLEPQLVWIRVPEVLADEVQYAALAYLSDSTLIDHTVLPHGRRWQEQTLNGASLDHSMWFHHPPRADDWLLFDQRVERTGGGRGLAQGRFFDRSGVLVASCMQEGMIRWED